MNTILGNMFKQLSTVPYTGLEENFQKGSYVKGMLETFIDIKAIGIKEVDWEDYDGSGSLGYSNSNPIGINKDEDPYIAINPDTKHWKQTALHEVGHLSCKDISMKYINTYEIEEMFGYYPRVEVIADVFAFTVANKIGLSLDEFTVTKNNFIAVYGDDKYLHPKDVKEIQKRANEFAEKYILTK